MKVILLAKVPGLGDIDDIKEVADGFAVNHLFPRHLAVLASPKAIGDLKSQHQRKIKEAENELKEQQSLASRLEGLEIAVKEKTNEAGFLYAAVGPQKIAETLTGLGFAINKNQIVIKPIKEPGEYKATVKLKHGLEAKINLIVNALPSKL
ncbi:MAG: 50S ribosomal protein L9 [Patescibacteria group bacterium]|nr:50S ribosomal protein L9 [Patescibacteria group bacterium]